MLDLSSVSGRHTLAFMNHFDYIRQAGSPDGAKAASEIVRQLEKELPSYLTVKTESFDFTAYETAAASFEAVEPYQKSYPAAGYRHSASIDAQGLTVPLVYAEYGDPISLTRVKGAAALLSIPVSGDLYRRLQKAGAAAFISTAGSPLDGGQDRFPQPRNLYKKPVSQDAAGTASLLPDIPGLILHYRDVLEILERGVTGCRLTLKQESLPKIGTNIYVTVPGTDPTLTEGLCVSAHYDSVPQGKGAYDNLSGAGIVFELALAFAKNPARRPITFVWFDGEELGLLGSRAFCKAHQGELENCRFAYNVDLAGQMIGGTVLGVTAAPEVEAAMNLYGRESGLGMSTKRQVWSSDSNSFAALGIPSVTMDRDGFGMHTRFDTLDLISPWALERDEKLAAFILDRLANSTVFPFDRSMPEEFLEKLKR